MIPKKSVLKDKSFAFAIRIVKLYKYLCSKQQEYVLSKQLLLRSGTAIGALIREATNAESTKDFIHKFGIAQKECDESIYWLELLAASNFINDKQFDSLNMDAGELLKMIRSTILTTKQNQQNS